MTPNRSPRFVSRLTRDTLALILAGGRGSRLRQLTDWRAKPAVPFGGKFRIIDFPLSNCINSGIRQVAVLTQYKSHSLIRHIQHGWGIGQADLGGEQVLYVVYIERDLSALAHQQLLAGGQEEQRQAKPGQAGQVLFRQDMVYQLAQNHGRNQAKCGGEQNQDQYQGNAPGIRASITKDTPDQRERDARRGGVGS